MFYGPPVTSAHYVIGTKKYPVSVILINYDDGDFSQGYGVIKEAFKALTKDDNLQHFISDTDSRSANSVNDIGHILYVFDIRYQKHFESAQPIKVKFKFDGVIPAGIYGCASVLPNKLKGRSK